MRPDDPLVTIVVVNHNYARYLGDAISSALHQTHSRIEVVVVDDGSDDGSREVMASFQRRIVPVCKRNGGQGSAYNAGWRAASGDIVMFLDSDDMLVPDAAARVAAVLTARPRVAHLQFRVAHVDAGGRPLGTFQPPLHHRLPEGDLVAHIVRHHGYTMTGGSGHAYPAWALRALMPVPEEDYRGGAETWLAKTAPFVGEVAAIEEPLGWYRVHDSNAFAGGRSADLDVIRRKIRQVYAAHPHLHRVALAHGVAGYPADASGFLDPLLLTRRMISLRLDPAGHPVPGDRLHDLAWRGAWAYLTIPKRPLHQRLLGAAWFLTMPLLPRRAAREAGTRFLVAERRGRLGTVIAALTRRSRRA